MMHAGSLESKKDPAELLEEQLRATLASCGRVGKVTYQNQTGHQSTLSGARIN